MSDAIVDRPRLVRSFVWRGELCDHLTTVGVLFAGSVPWSWQQFEPIAPNGLVEPSRRISTCIPAAVRAPLNVQSLGYSWF